MTTGTLTPYQLDQYQQGALTTAVFPLERAVDYCALGLVGEIGELLEALMDPAIGAEDVDSEIGDCGWYLAALADAMGWTLSEVGTTPRPPRSASIEADLGRIAGKVAGAVKKAIRDDKCLITDERAATIKSHLSLLIVTMEDLAWTQQTTAWAVMNRNLNKLEARKRAGTIQGDGDHR